MTLDQLNAEIDWQSERIGSWKARLADALHRGDPPARLALCRAMRDAAIGRRDELRAHRETAIRRLRGDYGPPENLVMTAWCDLLIGSAA